MGTPHLYKSGSRIRLIIVAYPPKLAPMTHTLSLSIDLLEIVHLTPSVMSSMTLVPHTLSPASSRMSPYPPELLKLTFKVAYPKEFRT